MSYPVAHFSPCHLKLKWRRKSCFGCYFVSAFVAFPCAPRGIATSIFPTFCRAWRGHSMSAQASTPSPEKSVDFFAEVTQRFSHLFSRKCSCNSCENMRKKIVILNRTSQYRVGVFSEHCFFRVFFWIIRVKFSNLFIYNALYSIQISY